MSIRIRRVEGVGLVALCAARSVPQDGDVYLDDEVHHALNVKFSLDHASEWGLRSPFEGTAEARAIEAAESNNANRTWWDATYGRSGGDMSPCACVDVEFGTYDNAVAVYPPPSLGLTRVPVTLDRCIALEVIDLWNRGIKTLASCCGHNKLYGVISVAPEHEGAMLALGYARVPQGFAPKSLTDTPEWCDCPWPNTNRCECAPSPIVGPTVAPEATDGSDA